MPEGSEQNQEDHSNNYVSGEMLTGHLRNKGQSVTAWAKLFGRSCKQFIPRSYTVFCNCYVLAGKYASLGFQVALGYGLDDALFKYRKGQEIFLFPQISSPTLGPAPGPLFNRCRCSFLMLKRPGSEVDHSTLCSVDVKNEWRYSCTPPYAFMTCTIITFPLSFSCVTW
jgi:hypothetical protein